MTCMAVALLAMPSGCGNEKQASTRDKIARAMDFRQVEPLRSTPNDDEAAGTQDEPSPRERLEARREAELAAVAVLPSSLPRDLKAACDELAEAYDTFMKNNPNEDAALAWYYQDDRRRRLADHRAGCIRRGSVKAAACATSALRAELQSCAELERSDIAARVLLHCASEYPEVDRALARG